MAAWQCASTDSPSPPLHCRLSLARWLLVAVFVGCLGFYAFEWRHYLALVLAPPAAASKTRFRYREYYKATFGQAEARTVARLQHNLTESLPDWLTEYVQWHAQVRASGRIRLEDANVLLVSIEGHHTGGLADRLRSLPFLLWEAVRTKRIFLMQWLNPCPLEEFLLPPLGGLDWTVPEVFDASLNAIWYIHDEHDNQQLADNYSFQNYSFIRTRHSPWTFVGGMPLLASALNASSLSDPIFSQIYRLFLAPSPPVQDLLDETMNTLDLKPHRFDGVHLRARYPGASPVFEPKSSLFSRSIDADGFQWTSQAEEEVLRLATHAIECLRDANHSTQLPIYFASDTNEAVKRIVSKQDRVVGMITTLERMHLNRNDRVGLIRKTPPSAFYPAVVDLWILSQARCLAVGAGGYGVFASILGETDCVVFHTKNSFVGSNTRQCPDKDAS